MKRKIFQALNIVRRPAIVTFIFLSLAVIAPSLALAADKPVRWNMQSWFASKIPLAGTIGKEIETKINVDDLVKSKISVTP